MNQNEFVLIVAPFKDKVFRLAKRLLVSTEEAEDATQEVLVKLWSKNGGLSSYSSIEAFAMTMTKNYCLDQSPGAGCIKENSFPSLSSQTAHMPTFGISIFSPSILPF